jgi:sugar phosphate isomerase/epimerase
MDNAGFSISNDYRNDEYDWRETESQMENIARAGFTHVMWCHDWYGEYLYSRSEMYYIRDLYREYGIKPHTLHASEGGVRGYTANGKFVLSTKERCEKIKKDYSSEREFMRLAGVDLLKNRIETCAIAGIRTMALHLTIPYGYIRTSEGKRDFYQAVYKSFDEVEPYAKCAGVRIALENQFYPPEKGDARFAEEDEKFHRMFDRYDEDFLGLCFDSGHATLNSLQDYYYFLETYNDRLMMTHLQDTDGVDPNLFDENFDICPYDCHRPPFTGVLDWGRIARGVAKAPRMVLPADFECVFRDPPSEEQAWLGDCFEKSKKFHAMVYEAKQQAVPS